MLIPLGVRVYLFVILEKHFFFFFLVYASYLAKQFKESFLHLA